MKEVIGVPLVLDRLLEIDHGFIRAEFNFPGESKAGHRKPDP
jgi:hypothetical protein